MARRRPTLMDPPVESLLDKVDSKFTLVALSSKRARQINSYYNQLGESLGVIVPPQVTSVSGKPLTIAFEEIATFEDHLPPPRSRRARRMALRRRRRGLEPGELTLGGVAGANDRRRRPVPKARSCPRRASRRTRRARHRPAFGIAMVGPEPSGTTSRS